MRVQYNKIKAIYLGKVTYILFLKREIEKKIASILSLYHLPVRVVQKTI